MAPPARRARAEIAEAGMPSSGKAAAALRKVAVSWVAETALWLRRVVYTVHSVVVGGALCARRWRTRRMSAATGQVVECPLRAWPTISPRTAFFWVVKVSMANVAS